MSVSGKGRILCISNSILHFPEPQKGTATSPRLCAGSAAELGITVGLLSPVQHSCYKCILDCTLPVSHLGKRGLMPAALNVIGFQVPKRASVSPLFMFPQLPVQNIHTPWRLPSAYVLSCKDSYGKSFLIRENNSYTEHKLQGSLSSSEAFLIY